MLPITTVLVIVLVVITNTVLADGPAPVDLASAGNYAIFAQTGVSTVPASAITGNIGLSPAASTALTGFSLILDSTGTFSTSTQVTGELFAADYVSPTPSILTTATSDMGAAFNNATGRINPDFLDLASGEIGGLTLQPGLYKWTTGVSISSQVFINGTAADTWIFQIAGTFTAAAAQQVTLEGGALAKNIVWVVSGAVTTGARFHLEGVVLAATGVTLETGTTANGRILAQTAIALQQATVVAPT